MALGVAGAAIGNIVAPGGPGARYGWAIGTLLGSAVEASKSGTQDVGRLDSLQVTGSGYGAAIPWVYGRHRTAGTIVYSTRLQESSKKSGVRLLGTRRRTFSYTVSCAVMICRGPITSVRKIWADDLLIYDVANTPATKYTITAYLGTWTQTPNSAMEAALGAGFVPAYRGRAYVVIENLPLGDWGNRVPNFQFEVEALPAYQDVIMGDVPLVYYRWEDTPGLLQDSSGNAYHQSLIGGTTSQFTGKHGEAIGTAAGTATLQKTIGSVAAFQGPRLSVESWFQYKGGSPTTGANRFRYRNGTSGEFSWELVMEPNLVTEHLVVSYRVFTNASGIVTVHTYSFTRDTAWHHAVVTYDQAGQSILYVDGVAASTVTSPVNPITISSDANTQIELLIDDNIRQDEAAFYTTILAPAQVLAHYEQRMLVRNVLADVFDQVGLDSTEWDVAEATDQVSGLKVDGRSEARQVIAPLLQVYATDILERDGKIAAKKRGGSSVVTIPSADLAARIWSPTDEPPSPVQAKRLQELELPFRVDLVYHSAAKDYEIATQGSMRYSKQHVQEALTLQTALVFTENQARQKVEELLYRLWVEREGFEFSLPPRYAYLTPGDVITLPVAGGTARVRLTRLDLGLPGPVRCEGVLDDVDVLTQVVAGGTLTDIGNIAGAVKDTTLIAWSSNAVVDEDADSIGFYVAANGTQTGYWPGAQLWWSRDGGASYQELAPIDSPAIHGTAATVLAAGTTTGLFDTTNTVDVTMTNGVPESVSDGEVFAGENLARLGSEIISFGVVTPQGGSVYRLSRLLRGRRGTDAHWGTHQTGERFVLLEEGLYTRLEVPDDLVGNPVLLKATTADGQPLAEATAQTLLITGNERKPYSVVDVAGSRDGSQNLTATWKRRTRAGGELTDYSDVPLNEATEAYSVHILNGTQKTVTAITRATQTVITSTAHGYSAGQVLYVSGVKGMVEINGLILTIQSVTTDTITVDVNSTSFTTYVSGGTVERRLREITSSVQSASYLASAQIADFGSAQPSVRLIVYQHGAYGKGYPSFAVV